MSRLDLAFGLLAETGRYRHMGQRFRSGGQTFEGGEVLAGIVVIVLVVAMAWLLHQFYNGRRRGSLNSPRRLFAELSRAHDLNWTSRQLLWQVVSRQNLSHPARVFLEPERLGPTALRALPAVQRRQLELIRNRIFSTEVEADEGSQMKDERSRMRDQGS